MSLINQNNVVSIASCSRYRLDTVSSSLVKLLEPWGGLSHFVKSGQVVLIKPNLLCAAKPEEAVTTHPLLIRAIADLVKQEGAEALIGDSPGSDSEETVYKVTGMDAVAKESGSRLIKFDSANSRVFQGMKRRNLDLASVLDQVDVIINVAKLKTHPLTGITASVKNTYGCIVGKKKAKMHLEHPLPADFARLVVDIHMAVKPALSIIDAVIAMEGTGPRSGKARKLNLLMASENGFSLDHIAARVVGIKPDHVTTCRTARKAGYPGTLFNEIDIKGIPLKECIIDNFDPGAASGGSVPGLLTNFPLAWYRRLRGNSRPYPLINKNNCINCGKCVEGCPAQIIISTENSIPYIKRESCIRCYCCREFCPEGAVEL